MAWAASQLDSYEIEFGPGSADVRAQNISRALKAAGARRRASQLAGRYLVNQAFRRYRAGTTDAVPRVVVRAMLADPKYVANRGVLSILLRSALAAPGRATPLS